MNRRAEPTPPTSGEAGPIVTHAVAVSSLP